MRNKYKVAHHSPTCVCYVAKCRECSWESAGWDYRHNAVAKARGHVNLEHGVNFPDGTTLGFGYSIYDDNTYRVVGAL